MLRCSMFIKRYAESGHCEHRIYYTVVKCRGLRLHRSHLAYFRSTTDFNYAIRITGLNISCHILEKLNSGLVTLNIHMLYCNF